MEINSDFKQRVVMHVDDMEWQKSPMPGVSRKMLDRIGDEVARATSIVRYAPGSSFSPHIHDGGEEFIVLEGVFQDEHGDHPAGSYIRNPPTSKHTPKSTEGCVIFVKLWQFELNDRMGVCKNINEKKLEVIIGSTGVKKIQLHKDVHEDVRAETYPSGAALMLDTAGGAEIFVLEGDVQQANDVLLKHSWLRLPIGANGSLLAGVHGVKVWIKTGHLRNIKGPN